MISHKGKTYSAIKKYRKIVIQIALGVLLFLSLGTLLLSSATFQTYLARKLTDSLADKYGINLSVNGVEGSLFTFQFGLNDVFAEDYKQDTLFYAKQIKAPILDFNALVKGRFSLGKVLIDQLTYKITTYPNSEQSNWGVFLEKVTLENTESSGANPFELFAKQVQISNARFVITDFNKTQPALFSANNLLIKATDFKIKGPQVNAAIKQLTFDTPNGIAVSDLSTQFSYGLNQMRFESLILKTPHSTILGQVTLDYDREDFGDFYNKVLFHAQFKDSQIGTADINLLYPEFDQTSVFNFSANLDGTLNKLNASNLFLTSDNTALRGDFGFNAFFDTLTPFYLDANIKGFESQYGSLKRLMPRVLGNNLPLSMSRLGTFTLRGNAAIGADQITTQINASTRLGNFYAAVDLSNITDINRGVYEGFLSLIDFDLGAYTQINALGAVSMDANIKGTGFLLNNLNTNLEGLVYNMTLKGYNYIDASVSGLFKNERFEGSLSVEDPNCKFSFSGLADFSKANRAFNFNASVDYADLHQMNLVKDSIALFKGDLDIDLKGTDIDNVLGVLAFKNTQYKNAKNTYFFEDFNVAADSLVDGFRTISINSKDIISGAIRGRYKLLEFGKLLQNAMGSIYTNYKPFEVTKGQEMTFEFDIYNTLVEIFLPEVQFGPNTFIRGALQADAGVFKLDFKSPQFSLYNNLLDSVVLKVDTKNPLFNTFLALKSAKTPYYDIEDLRLINNTLQDTLFFRAEFKGGKDRSDLFGLNFYHTFNDGKQSVIGLKKSTLAFKGADWFINEAGNKDNKVIFNKNLDSVFVSSLVMSSPERENVVLNGQLADSTYKDIRLSFSKVALRKIFPRVDSLDLDGKVNGELNILQKDNVYFPNSNLDIADFEINKTVLGNLDFDLLGNGDLSDFIINAKLLRDKEEKLRLLGNIFKSDSSDYQIKLLASFNAFPLEPFSPLGKGVIGNIRGGLWGNAEITGPIVNPDFTGTLTLNQAGISVPYLGVNYNFSPNAKIGLYNQVFDFKDITLIDDAHNTQAKLSGTIDHRSFDDWKLDLTIDASSERFLILNTPYDPEALYYGSGFLNGNGRIYGPTKALNIDVSGATALGTSLKIPLQDIVNVGDYTFIDFVEKRTLDTEVTVKELTDYRGLELNFDLAVTPEAEVEIVVDQKSGSSLKGTGGGILLMEINTNGKFKMFGDFVVATGSYNYKFGGFIDKTFKVNPGGSIIWDGDPMGAQLNMEASYGLFANPAPLLESSGYTNRIPTEVLVRLNGALENPNIDFDIAFPGTNSVVKSELQYALQDPTVQDRNAFFLLAQGTFVNDATGINQQAVTGNLLQSASGLLSSILEGSNDKLNFGLSYEQGMLDRVSNLQTDSRIGVSVSTQISDRVLFNGRLGVPVGGVTENVVAGDAEIQIILNDQGSLSAKIFNRENEIQQFLADRQGYTQGVGLSYQVDFNSFQELLRKILNKKEGE